MLLLTSCIISYHPRFYASEKANLYRNPSTEYQFFFSKDLFILSFFGVFYVNPTLLMLAIEHLVILHLVLPPIFSGLTPLYFFRFFYQLLLQSATTPSPPRPKRTRYLSNVFFPSYFITISLSNPNVQHFYSFFILKCESD